MGDDSQQLKLRAPVEDRQALLSPLIDRLSTILARNRQRLETWNGSLAGQPVGELREIARRQLWNDAQHYTRQYRDVDLGNLSFETAPFIITGHQPEFFHPGVWFKNFLLDRIARQSAAVPIHLIIDNNVRESASIRVPGGSLEEPIAQMVKYDRRSPLPFEERLVQDPTLLASFAQRATEIIYPLVPDILLGNRWPTAIQEDAGESILARRVARFRHRLEADCGLQTLEIPMSIVCDQLPFQCLVAQLVDDFKQIHRVHNEALHEHRQRNRIRSNAHPVPNLDRDDPWYELPFWIWTAQSPERQPLYVMRRDGILHIRQGGGANRWRLGNSTQQFVTQIADLRGQGVKIRPRALLTTLYARLFLSDLFLHGIGGAKYDELTDELIRRWLRVEPPEILVATSTLRLPISYGRQDPARMAVLRQSLRRLDYHPEDFLESSDLKDGLGAQWLSQKQFWIRQEEPAEQRKQRHDQITEANQNLRRLVMDQRAAVAADLEQLQAWIPRQNLLESREYSFCLYPFDFIQEAMINCLPSGE